MAVAAHRPRPTVRLARVADGLSGSTLFGGIRIKRLLPARYHRPSRAPVQPDNGGGKRVAVGQRRAYDSRGGGQADSPRIWVDLDEQTLREGFRAPGRTAYASQREDGAQGTYLNFRTVVSRVPKL